MLHVNIKCEACGFVSTEEKPMFEEIEVSVDEDNKERVVIVCPDCMFGEYQN